MGNQRNLIRRRKNFIRVNAMSVAQMIKSVEQACYTMPEIAEQCGLSLQTVRRYLSVFYKFKVVHIADWSEDKRGVRTVKIFGYGEQADAPKPKPQTAAQTCAKYRAKKKQMKIQNALTGKDMT